MPTAHEIADAIKCAAAYEGFISHFTFMVKYFIYMYTF